MSRARRWRQRAHQLAGGLAGGALFTATFAASLVLHGDLPATRRFLARTVTGLLSPIFEGRIVIQQIDHVGFDGVDVQSAMVLDPWGRQVIRVQGVHARLPVIDAARRLLASGGSIFLTVDDVRIDGVEVDIDRAPDGRSRIQAAFALQPRPPSPSSHRALRIELPRVLAGHGWVHGEPVAGLPIQGEGARIPGRMLLTEAGLTVDVERFALRSQFLPPMNPIGTADYHLQVDAEGPRMQSSFHGQLGEATVDASAHMEGLHLSARFDANRVSPYELHTLVPRLPIFDDVTVHGEVEGTLPELHATGRVVAGVGEVTAEVDARFVEGIEADARWSARSIDPRLFAPGSPPASLGGDGHARLLLRERSLRADLSIATFPFILRDQVVPGVQATAIYEGVDLKGKARVLEPGVDNDIEFSVAPTGVVDLDIEARAPKLADVTRLNHALDGGVRATIKAQVTPAGVIDATVHGDYQNLAKGQFKVARGNFGAHLGGAFDRLQAETALGAEQVSVGGFRVKRVSASGVGPLLSPSVRLTIDDERWKTLSVTTTVKVSPRPSLSQVLVNFDGGEVVADLKVASVEVGPEGVALHDLELSGPAARAKGSVHLGPSGLDLRVRGGFVDLPRLGRFLAPRLRVPALADAAAGTLEFDANLDAEGPHRSGSINVSVRGLCLKQPPQGSGPTRGFPVVLEGKGHFSLDNDQATADGSAELLQATCKLRPDEAETVPRETLASLKAQAEGALRGSILDINSWKHATGKAQLRELAVHLDKLSSHPLIETLRADRPKGAAPLPKLGGDVAASASIERVSPRELPTSRVEVSSKNFRLETPRPNDAKALFVEGLDLRTSLDLRPSAEAAGALAADWKVYLKNGDRELGKVTLAASARPEDAWREAQAVLDQGVDSPAGAAALAWVKSRPFQGTFFWRDTPLQELPPVIRLPRTLGSVKVDGAVSGTLDQPAVTLQVKATDLQREGGGWQRWAMSASVEGTLDERGLVVRGGLSHRSEGVNDSEGKADFWVMSTKRLGDLLWGRGTKWQLDAQATLDRWRLEATPLLSSLGVSGQVSGVMQAFRMHVQPYLWLDLTLDGGKFSDAALAPTKIKASLVEGGGFAAVTMQQPSPRPGVEGGELAVTAFPTVTFRDRLIPELDRARIHTVSLRATRFDIEPLSPLAAPALADLRGKLDGEVTLNLSAKIAENSLSGGLRWTDGVVLIPQLGQTFTNGHFNVTTAAKKETNETSIEIDNASLSATTGRVTGAASFVLPNDLLARRIFPPAPGAPAPAAAPAIRGHFAAKIAPSEKIPVTFEGLALGDAHGTTEGLAVVSEDSAEFHVAIPELVFDLPETTSQQNLQDLAENSEIGVVEASRKARGRRGSVPGKPRKLDVYVGIGSTLDDLVGKRSPSGSVLVRRASVDVRLSGVTHMALGDSLAMDGIVETLSGRVVALGKPFDIRRGYVRFEGPATNPYLNVGATWDSPGGTRVFADLQGYLKEAQFRFRSDPARPESEVLSLVLFGRDPSATTTLGSAGSLDDNLAVGSGVASTLLNSFIDPVQVFGRRIETRVESSASRGTSIGVAAEIRPRLWAQVDVSTAAQRERQNADLSAVTLDWRFRPNWSLRTTVGDRGSSLLELLWQFKY